jgi:CRISPR-associated endonuclease/helicase Cas3
LAKKVPKSPVNQLRKDVLDACRAAGSQKPTVFSLTVPTGGGKTLASLAFALEHAVKYNKQRIIYVIPFTSIIEQTAAVFRAVPGFENAVLEHHSNMENTGEDKETRRSRLACENWDAPLIVTTSVHFFESLYAAKTSRCRKLHNIANSVVIFDEAQCLPPEYLRPCVFAIRELQRHYKVTPLLCTATQPVLTQTKNFDFDFREGFESVSEIIADPESLARHLKRVEFEFLGDFSIPTDLETLKNAILEEKRAVLCILNRKEDARTLARSLPEAQTLHLSTNMCAKHRFSVLKSIKTRLRTDTDPFFVISTSLVEAGVDLDFPVVYRALAGLDSIAQAAGRCNREGKMPEKGRVVVFLPENQPNYVKQAAQIAREALKTENSDLLSPKIIKNYFKTRFWQLGSENLDKKGILNRLSGPLNYSFRSAAEDFKLIGDDWTRPLIAPDPEAQAIIDRMLSAPDIPARFFIRQLQPYIINIPHFEYDRLAARDYIHMLPEMPELCTLNPVLYDEKYGFIPESEAGQADPELYICDSK